MYLLPLEVFARPGMDEFRKIQSEISERFKTGNYQGALEKHIELRNLDLEYGIAPAVRNSFVLGDWMKLAAVYPPANESLLEIKQDLQNILLTGKGNSMHISELDSINGKLDDSQNTVDIFLSLEKNYPNQIHTAYIFLERTLIDAKRYDIIKRYLDDPIYKYESARFSREGELRRARTAQDKGDKEILVYANNRFIYDVVNLIEVSKAIGMHKAAQEVHRRAMLYFPNDKIASAFNMSFLKTVD